MSEDEGTTPSAQGVPSADDTEAEPAEAGDEVDVTDDSAGNATASDEPGDGAGDATDPTQSDPDESAQSGDVDSSASEAEAGVGFGANPEPGPAPETDAPAESPPGDATGPGEDAGDAETPQRDAGPETSTDVENLIAQISEHDDGLAGQVAAVVEQARELASTVDHQREELEDLAERVEAQAETVAELQATIEDREATLEDREEEIEDLKGRLKRKQADFQNYKKRAKKRQEQIKDRATEDLVDRLLGVRDNLTRALEEESGDVEALRDGVEMTLREFDRVLEDENVTEIDPEPGSEVDPQRHEVMMRIDSDKPEGTIADVYTPGYEMGEKVIQTAQVTVSNGELADQSSDDGAEDASGSSDDGAEDTGRDEATEPAADTGAGPAGHASDDPAAAGEQERQQDGRPAGDADSDGTASNGAENDTPDADEATEDAPH